MVSRTQKCAQWYNIREQKDVKELNPSHWVEKPEQREVLHVRIVTFVLLKGLFAMPQYSEIPPYTQFLLIFIFIWAFSWAAHHNFVSKKIY